MGEEDGVATISVTLSTPAAFTVTVDYVSGDGTATSGEDYTTASGTLEFPPGETRQSIILPVLDDTLDEIDETVVLTLSDAVGVTLGATNNPAELLIVDDDGLPTLSFSDVSYTVPEESGVATITVTLSNPSWLDVSVTITSEDGTATAGNDYAPISQTLTIPTGRTALTATLSILSDGVDEEDETLLLTLSNATNATVTTPSTATVTILDNDATLFLPLVLDGVSFLPDLVVRDLQAAANSVTLVIANQGQGAVTTPFWVDLYVDPVPLPTGVNQIWPDLATQGLVWGVTAPLQVGEVVTLTQHGNFYRGDYSEITWPLPAGAMIYVQVDSAHAETDYGAVLEDHESVGEAYNNIASTTVPDGGALFEAMPAYTDRPFHNPLLPHLRSRQGGLR
jgi:hypothetical protein